MSGLSTEEKRPLLGHVGAHPPLSGGHGPCDFSMILEAPLLAFLDLWGKEEA